MQGILLALVLGMGVGWLWRRWRRGLQVADRLTTVAVYVLLGLLGVSVGGNGRVMQALGQSGWQAFWLSLGAVVGSIALVWLIGRMLGLEREP